MTANSNPSHELLPEHRFSYSFLPIYIMAHLKTFSVGMMTTATSNHLLLEKNILPGLASFIIGLYSAGFFLSALLIGRVADKYGETAVLRYSAWLSILFGIATLIPITDSNSLIVFSLARFGDGITNGIFWPTVQKFTIFAEKCGPDIRKKYIMGYNLSWNTGALFSMILGVVVVYFLESNYVLFFINAIGAVMVLLMAYLWFQPLPKILPNNLPENQESNSSSQAADPIQISQNACIKTRLCNIPITSTLMVLLIHSLTDGAISILLPIKINGLGYASYWVFVVALIKSLIQTGASASMSKLEDKNLLRVFIATIAAMPVLWILFPWIPTLEIIIGIIIISGFCQGSIYALGMVLISLKAQEQNSARPYTFFQATMSGGRMTGPWLVGFFIDGIAIYGGLFIIVGYGILAEINFYWHSRLKHS